MGLWDRIRGVDRRAQREHFALVRRAAGVASVPLVCHEDVWSVLAGVSALGWDELPDDRIQRTGRMVEVELSGVNLVTLLEVTANYDRTTLALKVRKLDTQQALDLANQLRDRLAAVLAHVGPDGQGQVPAIRLDDKASVAE